MTFLKEGGDGVSGFLWKRGGKERKVPRIGPLFHTFKSQPDPEPGEDGEGRRRAEGIRPGREGAGRFALDHLRCPRRFREWLPDRSGRPEVRSSSSARRDVSAREIERHNAKVSRVLHYRMVTDKADQGLLIHMTPDGLITDFDIVED